MWMQTQIHKFKNKWIGPIAMHEKRNLWRFSDLPNILNFVHDGFLCVQGNLKDTTQIHQFKNNEVNLFQYC